MDINKLVIEEAEKSFCQKRKVGAIIIDSNGDIISRGHNHLPYNISGDCEDSDSVTLEHVIHAEIAAIDNADKPLEGCTIYVSHPPCANCAKAIEEAGLKTIIVEDFMKFDKGKLRYSLIPPIIIKALASVLTYGAKKYKPNNWQNVDDTDRYWDALYRHLEARREGEIFDKESKLPHLWHAITNIGFIIYLDDYN